MRLETLFRAHRAAEFHMATCVRMRGTNFGIAVEDDDYALRWQRYDRLAAKLEERIERDAARMRDETRHLRHIVRELIAGLGGPYFYSASTGDAICWWCQAADTEPHAAGCLYTEARQLVGVEEDSDG